MAKLIRSGSVTLDLLFFVALCCFVISATCTAPDPDKRKGRRYLSGDSQNLVAQFLVPQNQIRARVGDPPLQWSKKLASYARWWANQRRGDCSLTHSNGPYGENIFWGSGRNWQPRDAVSAWIGENKWYNYNRNSCNGYEECGHYTQVVWRRSRNVGCAKVICNNGDVFMTCNYDPPGNYIGQKPY